VGECKEGRGFLTRGNGAIIRFDLLANTRGTLYLVTVRATVFLMTVSSLDGPGDWSGAQSCKGLSAGDTDFGPDGHFDRWSAEGVGFASSRCDAQPGQDRRRIGEKRWKVLRRREKRLGAAAAAAPRNF